MYEKEDVSKFGKANAEFKNGQRSPAQERELQASTDRYICHNTVSCYMRVRNMGGNTRLRSDKDRLVENLLELETRDTWGGYIS